MRKIFLILIVFFAVSFSREFSLNELIDLAYRQSHSLAIADMHKEMNVNAIDYAKRNMLPRITFAGNYSYAITPYNSMAGLTGGEMPSFTQAYRHNIMNPNASFVAGDTIITSMLDAMFLGFGATPRNTLSGGIDIRQTIFAQNRLRHAVEYDRIQGRALICRWQDVRMRVKAEMTRLYYAALLAGEQAKIEQQSHGIARERHRQTLSLFEAQILSEIDTLNSFIDFSQAAVRFSEAKRGEREVMRAIAVAAGLTLPPDSIILTDTIAPSSHQFQYDILERHFLAENKTLQVLRNEVSLAEMRVKMAKGDYYPIVFGGLALNRIANFDGRDDFNFAPDRKVYLGITYDITPFGQRRIRVKQSEFDLKIAKRNFEQQKEQMLLLLRSNFEMIIEEHAKMEESRRIRDAAQKALDIAQNRYARGLLSQTDIDIAEQRFRQSGLMYLSAVSRYNSLLIDLRIMGADYLYEPLGIAENERIETFNDFYLRDE